MPRRSLSVFLGAATALALAFLMPLAAPAGMATIPLWRMLLSAAPATASRRSRGLTGQ